MSETSFKLPTVRVTAVCHDCRRKHVYEESVADMAQSSADWAFKHAGHRVEFSRPLPLYGPAWLRRLREFWSELPQWAPLGYEYGHNADAKVAYAASADYTITLASLATSSTRVVGRESTAISNASNKYLDYLIGGKIREGTTPTVNKQIDVHVYAAHKDTPTYAGGATGSDAALTMASENARNSAFRLAQAIVVDATTDRDYWVTPFPLGALYPLGIGVPTHHGLFVTHDTAVNLNSTGGNHVLSYTPVYGTIA